MWITHKDDSSTSILVGEYFPDVRAPSSTPVDHALPSGGHGNIHHNVPESRSGSNEENNLSTVVIPRHNDFHQTWGSNALPTELIRHIALQSIGVANPNDRLDASQVRKIFEMTRLQDWQQYYWDDAVVSAAGSQAAERSLQNLRATVNFLSQEKVWTNDTVTTIRGEDTAFPASKHLLLNHSEKFFNVQTPAKAIEAFLTEKHDGELSWSKPMKHNVRNGILEVLRNREGTPSDNRKEYVYVLLTHHKTLDTHTRDIERTFRRVHDSIEKLLQMHVLRPDDAS